MRRTLTIPALRGAYLLAVCLLLSNSCGPSLRPNPSAATRAESLAEEGKVDAAIAAYREHIELRLADPRRPESENPYFYLLMIGDLYLASGRIELAREAYEEARNKAVDQALTAERLRRFATHFEKKGLLEQAISELRQYRELDPLMFDSEIDRLHKLFIAREREKETHTDK